MRILITGGSGFIGRKLIENLKSDYEIVILSRQPQKQKVDGAQVVEWDGKTDHGWGHLADGAYAIINLAGENIGGSYWSPSQKGAIKDSRTQAGRAVMYAISAAKAKPKVLIQASAVGYYGNAPQPIDETAPNGDDFLAEVCQAWEESTKDAEQFGVRRVVIRTGVVIDPQGDALKKMMIPFYFFAGGPLGSGKQYFPWIHPADEIGAIRFLLENKSARGVYNLMAPTPMTNKEFARTLGKVMWRPSFMPAPSFALKIILGEMSMIVLEGQNARPKRLLEAGYKFKFEEAESALRNLLK